jgi:hypothetical protein
MIYRASPSAVVVAPAWALEPRAPRDYLADPPDYLADEPFDYLADAVLF